MKLSWPWTGGGVMTLTPRMARWRVGGESCVELRRYPRTHPFAGIDLTDNIVQFTTSRYHANPLVVRGPGAGPEVTAGGVFADLLRLAAYVA